MIVQMVHMLVKDRAEKPDTGNNVDPEYISLILLPWREMASTVYAFVSGDFNCKIVYTPFSWRYDASLAPGVVHVRDIDHPW